MKLSAALAAACVLSWGAAAALAPEAAAAAFLGMAAPLVVGLATIRLVERTVRADVTRLTARMAAAFAVKLVFYAVYVSVVVGLLRVDPVPFTLSFTFYFVALQIAEALYFRTLLVNASATPSAGR
ncbi:MAG: hypothetical protein OXG35_28845 [Acidobacteria bacterium]|nr:hypothetical protein [Acidobacteriota bacterium]